MQRLPFEPMQERCLHFAHINTFLVPPSHTSRSPRIRTIRSRGRTPPAASITSERAANCWAGGPRLSPGAHVWTSVGDVCRMCVGHVGGIFREGVQCAGDVGLWIFAWLRREQYKSNKKDVIPEHWQLPFPISSGDASGSFRAAVQSLRNNVGLNVAAAEGAMSNLAKAVGWGKSMLCE